jgi:hypothetical protein
MANKFDNIESVTNVNSKQEKVMVLLDHKIS